MENMHMTQWKRVLTGAVVASGLGVFSGGTALAQEPSEKASEDTSPEAMATFTFAPNMNESTVYVSPGTGRMWKRNVAGEGSFTIWMRLICQ